MSLSGERESNVELARDSLVGRVDSNNGGREFPRGRGRAYGRGQLGNLRGNGRRLRESNSRELRGNDGKDFNDNGDFMETKELAYRIFQIQSKRYYIDVKENKRGRFIKAVVVGPDGRKSQIFFTLATADEFREQLNSFGEFNARIQSQKKGNAAIDRLLKEAVIIKDDRRYFFDLKENDNGRFLKISQTVRGGPRSKIMIPAEGILEWRDKLTELLEEFGAEDEGFQIKLPEGRLSRVDNKRFYFDIGQNHRGIFMRISEVKNSTSKNITIPEKSWEEFRDIFEDYVNKMKAVEENNEK